MLVHVIHIHSSHLCTPLYFLSVSSQIIERLASTLASRYAVSACIQLARRENDMCIVARGRFGACHYHQLQRRSFFLKLSTQPTRRKLGSYLIFSTDAFSLVHEIFCMKIFYIEYMKVCRFSYLTPLCLISVYIIQQLEQSVLRQKIKNIKLNFRI